MKLAKIWALGAALTLAFSVSLTGQPAKATSPCQSLQNDIAAAINSSGSYGQTVPELCTADCQSLYAYYSSFPEVTYRDALAARLMELYAACNVSKVPAGGFPSTGTTQTPTHTTVKCPKIAKDMHGRKDFAGTTCLAGKVLAGFNLSGMDLTGASLRATNLTSANLGGAKLNRSDLTRAMLDYANLSGADFSGANLTDLRASHLQGSPRSLPSNWKLSNNFLFGPHVDLSKAWLKGATLDRIDLSYANLSGTNLDGAKLSNLNLYQTKFSPSLKGAKTTNLTGRPATFNILIVNGYLFYEGVNLEGANLNYADLRGKNLTGFDFKSSSFDYAKLDGTVFDKCDLTGASLQRLSAKGASFGYAKLQRADLSNSNLAGATLSYADIYSVRLTNTDLSNVKMLGQRGNTYVSGTPKALPTGWFIENGYLKHN